MQSLGLNVCTVFCHFVSGEFRSICWDNRVNISHIYIGFHSNGLCRSKCCHGEKRTKSYPFCHCLKKSKLKCLFRLKCICKAHFNIMCEWVSEWVSWMRESEGEREIISTGKSGNMMWPNTAWFKKFKFKFNLFCCIKVALLCVNLCPS